VHLKNISEDFCFGNKVNEKKNLLHAEDETIHTTFFSCISQPRIIYSELTFYYMFYDT
jgi:hypothetical protein